MKLKEFVSCNDDAGQSRQNCASLNGGSSSLSSYVLLRSVVVVRILALIKILEILMNVSAMNSVLL